MKSTLKFDPLFGLVVSVQNETHSAAGVIYGAEINLMDVSKLRSRLDETEASLANLVTKCKLEPGVTEVVYPNCKVTRLEAE